MKLKLNQTIAVRFDSDTNSWAVLDTTTLNPIMHFDKGVIKNVTLTSHLIKTGMTGCGGGTHKYIGIATGKWAGETYKGKPVGFRNLSFSSLRQSFLNAEKLPMTKVKTIRLFTERRAVYKN